MPAVRPAGPPPTITTSVSTVLLLLIPPPTSPECSTGRRKRPVNPLPARDTAGNRGVRVLLLQSAVPNVPETENNPLLLGDFRGAFADISAEHMLPAGA